MSTLARRYGERARQMVAAVAPNALGPNVGGRFDQVHRGEKASGAWSFHLRREAGWTRLVVRGNGGAVGHAAFDVPHIVMEQKMMRGIRDRAEQTAAIMRKYPKEWKRSPHDLEVELNRG